MRRYWSNQCDCMWPFRDGAWYALSIPPCDHRLQWPGWSSGIHSTSLAPSMDWISPITAPSPSRCGLLCQWVHFLLLDFCINEWLQCKMCIQLFTIVLFVFICVIVFFLLVLSLRRLVGPAFVPPSVLSVRMESNLYLVTSHRCHLVPTLPALRSITLSSISSASVCVHSRWA